MKIVSIVGRKNSGKTSLTEKIVKELINRGHNVATIKHSHHEMEMDREDTDTWRHKLAGSKIVVGVGATTFFNIQGILTLNRLLFLIKTIEDVDFVVIEGFKRYNYPKIATSPDVTDEYTIETVNSFKIDENGLKSLVNKIEEKTHDIVDTLFIDNCGYNDGASIAKEIRNGTIKNKELDKVDMNLLIEDKVIGLNEFVNNFMKKTIVGMINTLNIEQYGVSKMDKIQILINDNSLQNKKQLNDSNEKINLLINDKKVNINQFVKNFMSETILGMINSLRINDNDIKSIAIEMNDISYEDLSMETIKIIINNRDVAINDFVRKIMKKPYWE